MIEYLNIFLPKSKKEVKIEISVPRYYHQNTKFDTLYLLDGQNAFKDANASFNRAIRATKYLGYMASQTNQKIIGVAIHNAESEMGRINEYTPFKITNPAEENWIEHDINQCHNFCYDLINTIIPYIEHKYPTTHNRYIYGSSLAAITAIYLGYKYDVFKAIGAFSCASFLCSEFNDFIIKNPMTVVEKPKHHKTNGNALSNEDEKRLEIIFKQNGYDIFLICLYQGLRRGEALALTRDDIDFENKTLRINKSFNYFNELDTTKNRHSVRTMPLFEKTIAILESYRNTQGRLFNISQQVIEKRFNKCIVDFKTKYTIHSLRHTFITRCQEAQIPLHIIQKWVGHVAGSSVTNSVYTHARNDAEVENIKILNKKLNSN